MQLTTKNISRKLSIIAMWCLATLCIPQLSWATEPEAEQTQEVAEVAAEPIQKSVETDTAKVWDEANTSYINGDYTHAIELYNQLLAGDHSSSKVYYNLGNSYFKVNNLANAILNYHRALRLEPNNSDVRHNLEIAGAMTKDTITTIPEIYIVSTLKSLRHLLGCTAWSIVSIVAFALLAAGVILYLLGGAIRRRKAGFFLALGSLIVMILAMWFASSERNDILSNSEAIVMSKSISVKSSPNNGATDLFLLHEGTKIEITSELGEWSEIEIADGKKGWVINSKIEII